MRDIHRFVPLTKAKNKLLEIIREVEKDDATVAVTKNGVPAAVILSMERFEGLLETVDIFSDATTIKSLKKSLRQAQKGHWIPYEKVFGD
jgi:antitoxin YefM